MKGGFLILDFGSQYTQLIARRLREFGVYSEIQAYNYEIEDIKSSNFEGIILSGGPNSVGAEGAPFRDVNELLEIAPVLGICYGMQLLSKSLGGMVEPSDLSEYGLNRITWSKRISPDIEREQKVWMSHGDVVKLPPPGFEVVAQSSSGHAAAIQSERAWGFQFHPEVTHTEKGDDLLRAFVFGCCNAEATWDSQQMKATLTDYILSKLGKTEHVLCGLSGGVDSTVVATLLTRTMGKDKVHCVFVNNGLLRKNEFEEVMKNYEDLGLNVRGVDASEKFLHELKNVSDPEKKRKIIGKQFIEVFKDSIWKIEKEEKIKIHYLAQGTLYPDVIESVSIHGSSVTIKSHHNVGGLPEDLNLKLVEPLRLLFKDEVRALGETLGIPGRLLWRHPFPGPGLAIRIIGPITEEDIKILQEADYIFRDELVKHDIYDDIWQAFAVLLPVRTVGVQGDNRTYSKTLALRAVTSQDGMTADWFEFSPSFLKTVSNRITNEVKAINRVVYDITSKPPGTIEWE
mgnify:CR=1 FL=1|tara:strand:- start:65461 stop:67002 length:1542 start_codon:yes stop_codon:yes gene_type:complete